MAFAAGIGHDDPAFFDTTSGAGVVAHPVFPVALEWAVRGSSPGLGSVTATEARGGVHYSQHTTLHRPIRASERLSVTTTIVAVERHRAGALVERRYDGVDGEGVPVWTSYSSGLMRDAEVEGPDARAEQPSWPDHIGEAATSSETIDIGASLAHIYTECARIWNPIHTDLAVALAAGLPGLILHGTATLALAVSAILRSTGRPPISAVSLGCRFGAMVEMPTQLVLESAQPDAETVLFSVLTPEGRPAIRNGFVRFS